MAGEKKTGGWQKWRLACERDLPTAVLGPSCGNTGFVLRRDLSPTSTPAYFPAVSAPTSSPSTSAATSGSSLLATDNCVHICPSASLIICYSWSFMLVSSITGMQYTHANANFSVLLAHVLVICKPSLPV